jgi:hypothetical protein
MRLQADRRGRAAAIVPTGSYELIAFARGSGWVHRKLDTAELSSQENPLELTFGPWNYVRGRVIDVDGKGIANASIRSAGSSYSGNIPYLLRNVSSLMRHAKSDANGSFELPFIGYSGMTFRLRASASRPGKSRLTSKDTVQVGTENLDDVRVRADRQVAVVVGLAPGVEKRQSAPGVETALLRRNAAPKRILIWK